eukprot:3872724-Pyramimonas_sp.AAC.1
MSKTRVFRRDRYQMILLLLSLSPLALSVFIAVGAPPLRRARLSPNHRGGKREYTHSGHQSQKGRENISRVCTPGESFRARLQSPLSRYTLTSRAPHESRV